MSVDVCVVTRDAGLDALHPDDYREIYDELRQYDVSRDKYLISHDKFIAMVGSEYSKALWSKWEHGDCELNRAQKNELRRVVGIPELTPTIAQAVACADENAEVVRVGADVVRRVVLVGVDAPLSLHLNGAVEAVLDDEPHRVTGVASKGLVTPVTFRLRRNVSLPLETFVRANGARVAAGLSWEQLIGMALERIGGSVSS